MTISFDPNLLLSYYQSRLGAGGVGTGALAGPQKKVAPTAPWSGTPNTAEASAAVKAALLGRKLIDENAAKLDLTGASADYKKMFALYQGLSTLSGVAERANAKGLTAFDKGRIEQIFQKGMSEIAANVDDLQLDQLRLKAGEVSSQARSKLGVPKAATEYLTPPLVSGSSTGLVPAFQGDVKFNISIKRINTTSDIAIDLADMGATPRTLGNVISHINQKLQGAGLATRVASQRIPGEERTIQAGGKTVKLSPGPDQWALKIKADSGETISFSAPATAPSVYLAQSVGDPDPDKKPTTDDGLTQRQLLKFQTDTSAGLPAPLQPAGEANWVDGRVFAKNLGPNVEAVHETRVGADGSVYVLADITGETSGQGIRGEQDVALLKYDAAGKLMYTRTLGASDEATGLALALSADGKIAIAGSLKGSLSGAVEGALNSGATGTYASNSDSFVTVFDGDGQELWTQRRGARQDDEASELTFGADGTVYVAGRAKSALPGATAIGGWDSYIEAFKVDAKGVPKPVFTQTFGTAQSDAPAGMVLDGTNLVTASIENGRAVLRRFDVSGAAPVLTSTRDLGDMGGGEITGLALDGGRIVIAGSTGNPALAAGAVSRAHSGGQDAFVAQLSTDLNPAGSDRIAYYGGAGDDRASSLAVSGGRVFIAGSAGADLPDQAAVGKKDGFLTEIDISTGALGFSRRFTGKDGYAAPSAIAVDATGSSVLDRLGLPKGTLDLSDSTRLTAVSALRPGDQFTVRSGAGSAKTVTIDGNDTLDTLATKVRRALGFQAKVTIATVAGQRHLQIAPLNERMVIEIGAGKTDKDALSMLGLAEGVVRMTKMVDGKSVAADGKGNIYGLGLPGDLNLSNAEQIRHSLAELAAAMGVIRTAYKDLVSAASPKTPATVAAQSGGKVPAYLTNQIANYQAALDRLGG